MIDLSEKSREEVIREKKEAELRLAKRKKGEWKRRLDKERKCMIEFNKISAYVPKAGNHKGFQVPGKCLRYGKARIYRQILNIFPTISNQTVDNQTFLR